MVNCKEKDLELCAIQLHLLNMCIVCVYRAPSGDFLYFIQNLEDFLNKLYRHLKNIIICGDVNINYFINNSYKQQLDSLMASYGLHSTISFSTRTCHNSSTAIDNIFTNKCKTKIMLSTHG
jgi:exonuclease III